MRTHQNPPTMSGAMFFKSTPDQQPNGPRIGTDDGISNRGLNLLLILFMLLTVGLAVASANDAEQVKNRILLRQSMLDIEYLRYEEAIPKLMEVMAKDPDNANVSYLLGVCHLYGTRNYHQAAFYLERASRSVSASYESWVLEERNAPVQSIYLLATAWEQANDNLRAMLAYEKYFQLLTGGDVVKVSERIRNIVKHNINNIRLRSYEHDMMESATALH